MIEICDKGNCPAVAMRRFLFKNGEGELMFCDHHGREFSREMPLFDWSEFIQDYHRELLPERVR